METEENNGVLQEDKGAESSSGRRRFVGILLVSCAILVSAWEIGVWRSERPRRPFSINVGAFADFMPAGGWVWRQLSLPGDPNEPNILVYKAGRTGDSTGGAVSVRLVHGYNMADCMRIKHYKVELTDDRAILTADAGGAGLRKYQVWRLTAPDGTTSAWVTSLIRADTFAETGGDVRNMAFPRVSVPDDAGWMPQGLRLSSLKHPVENFGLYLRSRWNSSRCDLLTFLRLRQPAGADDRTLVIVAMQEVGQSTEAVARENAFAAANAFHSSLTTWRATR